MNLYHKYLRHIGVSNCSNCDKNLFTAKGGTKKDNKHFCCYQCATWYFKKQ